jgi:hypothetical protein
MWFWKKKVPTETVEKRKPRIWSIPPEHLEETIGLYDNMMEGLVATRLLPRYLFWRKILEIMPETSNFSVRVERAGGLRCIEIVEDMSAPLHGSTKRK